MSRHPLLDMFFNERGWAALLSMEEPRAASAQPQHAAAWDPAQVHQLPCSCRRTGMVLDAKTSLALSQALILPWDKCSSAASRVPVHSPLHHMCCIWVSVSSCLSLGPPAWGSWGYGDAITLIISCCFSQRTPSGKWSVKAQ